MRRYERNEYENLDEYEHDGTESEEEEDGKGGYEEEETYQPAQDQLEYLELRNRLKESFRKEMKEELGTANAGSRDRANTYYRKDNYGSFFGPSQPVIAQRVIQESKSLLENPNLAARIVKPKYDNTKSSGTTNVRSKTQASFQTKVTSGLKKKVEMLKNTRDYSFLSEDAEVPAPMKSPPSRNVNVPKSEAHSNPLPSNNKRVVNDRGREVSNGHEHRERLLSGSKSKVGPDKIDNTSRLSVGSRKPLGSNSGSGPGRPSGLKPVPSRSGPSIKTKVSQSTAKISVVGREKSNPSSVQSIVRKPTSHNQSGVRKPIPSSSQPSLVKNQSVQRKEYQETSKLKTMPKQTLSPSRPHVKQQSTIVSGRSKSADVRPKAKIGRQPFADDPDDDKAIDMIRKMFRYNPNRYQDADDDSDMEANFDDILREERRSEKIGKREDEEELRKLEEEDRRKQQLRLERKRKLGH